MNPVTISASTINSAVGWLSWASMFHIGGPFVAVLLTYIAGIRGWLGTPAGKADLQDAQTILSAAADIVSKRSTHPDALKAVAVLQAGVIDAQNAALPSVSPTVPKVPLILLAFLLAGLGVSKAHAVSLSLGPISISPTAGPCVVTVIPAVEMSFYRMGAGAIFTNENDGVVGIQALLNWGQYNVGIEGAFDKDITDNVNYGAAGVVVGLQPYGQIAALWRDKGAILGYSVPLTSIGISAQ